MSNSASQSIPGPGTDNMTIFLKGSPPPKLNTIVIIKALVRVGALVLFLISGEMLSIFYH